jgi:DNA-binding NtrC family response regulator
MDTSDMVADAGFHVIRARTADEALDFMKQHSCLQLLFTDTQMPGEIDGDALAVYVAEHWPHIKVIVASGAIEPEEGVLPQSAMFLNKPISADLVNESLREFLASRGSGSD